MKLKKAEVKAIGKIVLEFIETEIKLEFVFSSDKSIFDWFFIKTDFLLMESSRSEFVFAD